MNDMAVLKVKNGDEWVAVVSGGGSGGILPPDEYRTLWGTWAGDFGTGSATDENGKLKSDGISSVAYISLGCYDISFDEPFQDNKYCWVGQAGTVSLTTPTTTVAGLRTGVIAPEKLRVFSNFINLTHNELFNYDSLSVIIFNRID